MNKNKLKTIKYPINLIRVLDVFVGHPLSSMTVKNLLLDRGLRTKTNERRTRDAVNILVGKRILRRIPPWGAPRKRKNEAEKSKEILYELSKTASAFKRVLSIYLTKDVHKLLASDYANIVIGEIGFEKIYKIIQPHLSLPKFKLLASESLLHHRATVDEYVTLANELRTKILESNQQYADVSEKDHEPVEISRYLLELSQELSMKQIKPIEILSSFAPLQAVRFYRETLHEDMIRTYDELEKISVITKGLRNFMVFDNYLSPLTAHPLNSITKILFSKPFERIYEDAYLLDGESFRLLSMRAMAIYNNFSDFLSEYFESNSIKREEWGIVAKEMIYSWNVASTRFDMVYYYLGKLHIKKLGSGNYHLRSNGLTYNIIDLNSGKSLLDPYISASLLELGSIPRIFKLDENEERFNSEIMKDPFSCLRQCITFEESPWRKEMLRPKTLYFEDIISELDNKKN